MVSADPLGLAFDLFCMLAFIGAAAGALAYVFERSLSKPAGPPGPLILRYKAETGAVWVQGHEYEGPETPRRCA